MADGNTSGLDPTKPLESQTEKQQNNNEPKLTGFQLHPENINKNGRPPKGYSITETFQQMLGAKAEVKQALVNKILKAALEGDMTAAKMIWQYMDGMPAQSMDLTSKGEQIRTPTHFIPVEKEEQPEA